MYYHLARDERPSEKTKWHPRLQQKFSVKNRWPMRTRPYQNRFFPFYVAQGQTAFLPRNTRVGLDSIQTREERVCLPGRRWSRFGETALRPLAATYRNWISGLGLHGISSWSLTGHEWPRDYEYRDISWLEKLRGEWTERSEKLVTVPVAFQRTPLESKERE